MNLFPKIINDSTIEKLFNPNNNFSFFNFDFPNRIISGTSNHFPTVDIEENDKNIIINAELPGINKKDIKLEYKNNYLTLSGEKKIKRNDNSYSERSYGKFKRIFKLNDDIDINKTKVEYKNGILNINLIKNEKQSFQIKIN